MTKLVAIIIAALAIAGTAGAQVLPPPIEPGHHHHHRPPVGCGPNSANKCPVAPAAAYVAGPSSSPMCRILDAREPVAMVLDSEILSTAPGTRSLANGWTPAAFIGGAFVCAPVVDPVSWTDDSLSVYDAPNTAYANPIG